MKKMIVLLVMSTGLTTMGPSAASGETDYIPWTFDDFDSNCEVIRTAEIAPAPPVTTTLEIPSDEQIGELGW